MGSLNFHIFLAQSWPPALLAQPALPGEVSLAGVAFGFILAVLGALFGLVLGILAVRRTFANLLYIGAIGGVFAGSLTWLGGFSVAAAKVLFMSSVAGSILASVIHQANDAESTDDKAE